MIDFATLEKGQSIGSTTIFVNRADLVRYAGASGDFNPIHWNERFATEVGLPGVIAHGMFTMGAAVQLVSDWAQDPGAVIDYQTRFTKPVPVADPAGSNPAEHPGTAIEIVGTIGAAGRRGEHRTRGPERQRRGHQGAGQGPGRGATLKPAPGPAARGGRFRRGDPQVLPWRNGVLALYLASGLALSTLVSRLPSVRDALGLSHGEVGLLLLCMTAGSFASVSVSGFVVMRLGSKRTLVLAASLTAVAMALVGVAAAGFHSLVLTGVALGLQGVGNAAWNVSSNVQGAAMERALGVPVMPALHGFFSVGTVLGAAAGAVGAAVHLSISWHFAAMSLLVLVIIFTGTRVFRADPSNHGSGHSNKSLLADAWREPRTLVLGILVLGMALAEGAAGDWVALALSDGYGAINSVGAVGYGVFVTAMTLARLGGGASCSASGAWWSSGSRAASTLAGPAALRLRPLRAHRLRGPGSLGPGGGLCFPVAMTAASDDPMRAAARVSVVSTIGYGAFLGGPPLLGLLADHVGPAARPGLRGHPRGALLLPGPGRGTCQESPPQPTPATTPPRTKAQTP